MSDGPKPFFPSGRPSGPTHEELARARARIKDLEAALAVSERKSAEVHSPDVAALRALERSEARFRKLIENLRIGVVVQGPKSEILLTNGRALELLGMNEEELTARTSFDPSWRVIREDRSPFRPEERPVAMVLTTRAPVRGVVMGIERSNTGDVVWLLVSAEPELDEHGEVVQVVATLDDITERKKLEDSVRESQRLDSLGLLAGGIAHDFNNLLAVITTCAELAKRRSPPDGDAARDLEQVLVAADRATNLARQLLTFARRHSGAPRPIDVCAAVSQFENLLQRLVSERHHLRIEAEPGPIMVRIDQNQLEQVLVNLVVNARDAMPNGGRIRVSVGSVGRGEAPGELAERGAATLAVRDTGTGMTPEVLARAFEPFFTTKSAGHGTGLGLMTVQGIVHAAGGQVTIASDLGVGTEVKVYLPLLSDSSEPLVSRTVLGVGRGERVLVVDDDDVLRAVTSRMLTELGYHAEEAHDGLEALDALEAHVFDAVLTDVVMPRMGGIELAHRVRERWPAIRIVGSSGRSIELELDRVASFDAVLPKPFNMAVLGRTMREALDA